MDPIQDLLAAAAAALRAARAFIAPRGEPAPGRLVVALAPLDRALVLERDAEFAAAEIEAARAWARGIAVALAAFPETEDAATPAPLASVVAESALMRAVCERAARAARSRATILIHGETGTGKEVLARAVHLASDRARGPFVAVSCAEIGDGLAESALFGHRRGSFTGASEDAPGLFVQADRGTLFLDELGEASPPFQAKLLRAVETGDVRPIGGRARSVDVRIVAATHDDLAGRVARGTFRADLYHRLAAIRLDVPPLRERPDDVLPLARRFLADLAPGRHLSRSAVDALLRHRWPGNARELRNALARAVALGGDQIGARHLGLEPAPIRTTRARGLAEVVEREIDDALAAEDGNVRRAASRLGIHRATLHRRLRARGGKDLGRR